jgi:hypothetical protein
MTDVYTACASFIASNPNITRAAAHNCMPVSLIDDLKSYENELKKAVRGAAVAVQLAVGPSEVLLIQVAALKHPRTASKQASKQSSRDI